ncbi:MAG TPA: peptide-methionine (S)-S-oxide reductase MsrA [Bacteroidia bacterium]|nr:peptide-methionine (S)-S-oxide reductase MsrA [Bacteroidia bacterium]
MSESKNEILSSDQLDTATFGAGCFWCVEAIFQQVKGVEHVESGYAGGHIKNPSYEMVCSGKSGHAEVIQLLYNPQLISYDELLEIFWKTHDPTTLNRQGADVGTQYRSSVFYHNEEQKTKAEYYKNKLNEEKAYDDAVVTTIEAYTNYTKAEKYHQDYYNQNQNQPYCSFVIQPKLDKFKKAFQSKLK